MLRGLKRLNRYENRILSIIKNSKKSARLKQLGFSTRTKDGFRFPIHAIEIGSKEAIKKNPVGLVAGVHGLETIGIRVLLDFLEIITNPVSSNRINEIDKGKVGLVCIPILNPGGVILKTRSNPNGVDLMRNSGIDAQHAVPFFGGQKMSKKLPYYRGNLLQIELKILQNFVKEYFFQSKSDFMCVLDIHSGFGSMNRVWWPYAGKKKNCEDNSIYQKISDKLSSKDELYKYKFEPQSISYTTHGDIWDKLYDDFLEMKNKQLAAINRKFLPLTLEIGTWSDLKNDPLKIFRKRGIFNPSSMNKKEFIKLHREFLANIVKLANSNSKDWL